MIKEAGLEMLDEVSDFVFGLNQIKQYQCRPFKVDYVLSVIKEIFRDNNYILVDLLDKFCPILGNNHDNEELYMELTKSGIVLKCRCKTCKGKIYPNNNEIKIHA